MESKRDQRVAVILFVVTLASVFLVYGYQWMGGDPLSESATAIGSAKFAGALMAILLAHEMGHYLVARRHGFSLSLPYFIPFPSAFGTLGAVIRLKSLPESRTALLEMGAAGPLAGFAVAVVVLCFGLPNTIEHQMPQMMLMWPPVEVAEVVEPGKLDLVLGWLFSHPPLSWLVGETEPGSVQMMILANPLIMDIIGSIVLGGAPGRYAELDPFATAGWVGCLLTGINLIPIGSLDGGHIMNAAFPTLSRRITKLCLILAFFGAYLWMGWLVWAGILTLIGATFSTPAPKRPPLSSRAKWISALVLVAFILSFMPAPVEIDTLHLDELEVIDLDGKRVPVEELQAWMDAQQP